MLQVIQNYRTGVLEVVEVPPPVVRPGTLLIHTAASLVSAGTERHLVEMAQKSLLGKALARPDLVRRVWDKVKVDGVAETLQQVRQRLKTPVPLGYSAAGTVIEVGPETVGFQVGDLVAVGGQSVAVHAEILCAPPTLVALAPPGVPAEYAAFGMVGAISLHAVRLARVQPGEWVAVIGLGLLGLLATQMLRAAGYRVLGLDLVPSKLALAKSLGVEAVYDSTGSDTPTQVELLTGGHGADAVLITAGTSSNEPLDLAARISRVRGRIVAVGLVGLDVPRSLFFDRELELVVSRASGPGLYDRGYETHGADYPYPFVRWTHARNMSEFLRLVATGSVRLDPLITHRFPISQAVEAYGILQGKTSTPPIGIILEYPGAKEPRPSVIRFRDAGDSHRPRATVRLGLIGAGLFARTTLLPELRKLAGLELVGVATSSGLSAQHAAKSFGFRYATTNPQDVITDPEIDCVLIATRHDSHARLAAMALRAGKDVFVEKPLALSTNEFLEVAEAWAGGTARLMVGFNRRHSSHAVAARRYLADAGGPAILHCRVNAGDVPAGSWVNDPQAGGDRIRGELCHFVDLAHFLLGGNSVVVEAAGLPPRRSGEPVEDLTALLRFADGSLADLVYTARGHRSLMRERVEVFRGGRVSVLENFRVTRFYGQGAPRVVRTWRLDRGYRGELAAWLEALTGGGPAPVPFVDYAASTLATLAVAEAVTTGRAVGVDLSVIGRYTRPVEE